MTIIQTGVNPIPSPSSNGWEIAVPFRIDPATGGVALLIGDLDILNQHLATIINTEVNERLMMPTYGTDVPGQVFAPETMSLDTFLEADISAAIKAWEPAVELITIQIAPDATTPSATIVAVTYRVKPLNDVNGVTVLVGGGISQVASP